MNPFGSKYKNTLLAALIESNISSWKPQLQFVELAAQQVLYESGDELSCIYFPVTAVVSLLHILENGDSTEIAMTGREGVVGISVFMGNNATPSRGVVQQAGTAYRVNSCFIKEQFAESLVVMQLMLRFTQALISQMSQVGVCNRHHGIEQQLSRWLLFNFDRIDGDHLHITHEQIAHLLGVRREGISRSASDLQKLNLIEYQRGNLHLLDRQGLRAVACECYGVVKQEYARLQANPRSVNTPRDALTRLEHMMSMAGRYLVDVAHGEGRDLNHVLISTFYFLCNCFFIGSHHCLCGF